MCDESVDIELGEVTYGGQVVYTGRLIRRQPCPNETSGNHHTVSVISGMTPWTFGRLDDDSGPASEEIGPRTAHRG